MVSRDSGWRAYGAALLPLSAEEIDAARQSEPAQGHVRRESGPLHAGDTKEGGRGVRGSGYREEAAETGQKVSAQGEAVNIVDGRYCYQWPPPFR